MTQSELILCSFNVLLIALGFVLWKYKPGKWTVGYCSNYCGFFLCFQCPELFYFVIVIVLKYLCKLRCQTNAIELLLVPKVCQKECIIFAASFSKPHGVSSDWYRSNYVMWVGTVI